MTRLATAWSRALDVVFPPRCVGCRTFGSFFCDLCVAEAPRPTGPRCPRCWTPGRQDSCLACYSHPPAFRGLRSTFLYAGSARSAVLALKYNGVSAAAPSMAAPMAETLKNWAPPVDVIVPVPLSGMRQRTRGYNQAESLARELERLSDLPVDRRLLKRQEHTSPQTRQKDAAARRRNVASAFSLTREDSPERVLLVDDVTTTGATLDACARILQAAGAISVYALTFARED